MRHEKQLKVIEMFNSGRYSIDPDAGILYSHIGRKKVVRPIVHSTGYRQVCIRYVDQAGVRSSVMVYLHVAVWLWCNGVYDEGMHVDHIDRDRGNNAAGNLRLCTARQNILYKISAPGYTGPNSSSSSNKLIRSQEIAMIKDGLSKGMSQSAIARELGLNRLSVRYIIKRIESGAELKFE